MKILTSCVWINTCLVIFSIVVWNTGDDDNPVVVVGESLVVRIRLGGVSTDRCSCRDRTASSGIDQSFDFGCILGTNKFGKI